jgi:hypothetical protein
MLITVLLVLVFLQFKHWYIDFVNQTDDEVKCKGIYLNWVGIKHSLKHGIGTILCVFFATFYLDIALILGLLDFVIHYHIDWIKMNYGCKDITKKSFWSHLGLDQMLHHLTYIGIAIIIAQL